MSSSSSSSDTSKDHSINSTQKWKNAESAVRELLKLSKRIPRAERALTERKSLLKELAEAKSLLAHQKQTHNQIITEIENRYATWMEEKSFAEREMQKKIAHASKVKDEETTMLKADLESSMRSFQLKERECEDSAFRLAGIEEHLRRAQKELERLKADIGFEDIDAAKLFATISSVRHHSLTISG